MNLYTYGHNSPLYYSDPSGHWAILSALADYVLESDRATAAQPYGGAMKFEWSNSFSGIKEVFSNFKSQVSVKADIGYTTAVGQMQQNTVPFDDVMIGQAKGIPIVDPELHILDTPRIESKLDIRMYPRVYEEVKDYIHQTPVQNLKDIKDQMITDPMINEDKVTVISSSNLNQYQSSTEFANSVYSQSKKEVERKNNLPRQGIVRGKVEGAPPVDAGKQGKHVPGHKNNINPDKSQWPNGQDGVDLTQEAWIKGRTVKPDGSVKVYNTEKAVGPNGETRIKVHMDKLGNIHGYPIP